MTGAGGGAFRVKPMVFVISLLTLIETPVLGPVPPPSGTVADRADSGESPWTTSIQKAGSEAAAPRGKPARAHAVPEGPDTHP